MNRSGVAGLGFAVPPWFGLLESFFFI